MIEPEWRRMAAIHIQEDGNVATVWLAHDKDTDCVHLYDACMFRSEVLAVIAEGLNARGRWIPVSWEHSAKEMADKLLDRGCNMYPDGIKTSVIMSEVTSRDIQERMRSGRFKVDARLNEWKDEFKIYYRQDAQVPQQGYPLMVATQLAMEHLEYAKRQAPKRGHGINYPRIAVI